MYAALTDLEKIIWDIKERKYKYGFKPIAWDTEAQMFVWDIEEFIARTEELNSHDILFLKYFYGAHGKTEGAGIKINAEQMDDFKRWWENNYGPLDSLHLSDGFISLLRNHGSDGWIIYSRT